MILTHEYGSSLVIPIYSNTFEYISNSVSNGFINLQITYANILYDTNAIKLEFYHTQENITVKQLRDKHKKQYKSIIFRFKDDKNIRDIEFTKPSLDISKDSYGEPCVKLTWGKINTNIYEKKLREE